MWGVFNEFGQIASFETREDAESLASSENEDEPGSHWVLHVSFIGE